MSTITQTKTPTSTLETTIKGLRKTKLLQSESETVTVTGAKVSILSVTKKVVLVNIGDVTPGTTTNNTFLLEFGNQSFEPMLELLKASAEHNKSIALNVIPMNKGGNGDFATIESVWVVWP